MIVEDNGQSIFPIEPTPSDSRSKRLGLPGVGDHRTSVPAALDVESAPGQGCMSYIRRAAL
jgi:hypothetical protein